MKIKNKWDITNIIKFKYFKKLHLRFYICFLNTELPIQVAK